MCEECSIVQVHVNLCTMNGWREERQRQKEKSLRCCHPFLNMFSSMCVSVSVRQLSRSHILSLFLFLSNLLIIFNYSLVDRACENSRKINCLFIPFHCRLYFSIYTSRYIQTSRWDQSIHCYILLSKQNMTMTFLFSSTYTLLILVSVV